MSDEEEQYDYYFAEDLLSSFSQRFKMDDAISNFISLVKQKQAGKIESAAEQVLGKYSQELSKALVESAKEPFERTGQLIYQVAEKTGVKFPSIPQRLVELGFMSTRPQDRLVVPISTLTMLSLRVTTCAAYTELKNKLGERMARDLPCKYGCLASSKSLFDQLGIATHSKTEAVVNEKGYCEFSFELQEGEEEE
ncbi:MAG: hypothetical protein WED05_04385 [Candidatus Atabeyarchaeum deiterrae]